MLLKRHKEREKKNVGSRALKGFLKLKKKLKKEDYVITPKITNKIDILKYIMNKVVLEFCPENGWSSSF